MSAPRWNEVDLKQYYDKLARKGIILHDQKPEKQNKYRNKKVETEVGTFDSIKEWKRWLILKDMLDKQEIFRLYRQTVFEIEINGHHICNYKSDFDYWKNGQHIIEDVKGFRTAMYRLKKKLVEASHNVIITEV